MEVCEAVAGTLIFEEGEEGEYACIICNGHVQILKHTSNGEVELAVLGPGDVFGEMSLFEPGDRRSATARALDHVVVEVLTVQEMQELIGQCPDMLQPFLLALVSRLRETNRRLAEKERATVRLGHEINTIYINPCKTLAGSINPISWHVTNLPFSIGGYHEDKEPTGKTHLEIPCSAGKMNVSYEHCSIEQCEDGIYVIDQGSRHKSVVNGRPIGRGEASSRALLLPGENEIILGDPSKDMRLMIHCE